MTASRVWCLPCYVSIHVQFFHSFLLFSSFPGFLLFPRCSFFPCSYRIFAFSLYFFIFLPFASFFFCLTSLVKTRCCLCVSFHAPSLLFALYLISFIFFLQHLRGVVVSTPICEFAGLGSNPGLLAGSSLSCSSSLYWVSFHSFG